MKKLTFLLSFLLCMGAFGQSTLTVNKSTGAITGPISASTFATINAILQTSALDTDSTMAANSDTKIATQKATKTALATKPTASLDTDGTLAANSDASVASQKAVKTYVDTTLATFDIKPDVAYVSLSALPANTYSNGSSGVGATLTGTSNGPLVIDGVTLAVGAAGQRILVAAESTAANDGWYTVTRVGVVAVSTYQLTRATESDTATEIGAGYLTGVVAPNTLTPGTNNGKLYISVAADPFTVGTTSLTFSQVGGTYSAGTGLSLSGSTFSVDTTVTPQKSDNLSVFASTTSAQLRGILSDELGTGVAIFDGATPSTGLILTNSSGLPISTGVNGLGTGVATALGVALNSAGGFATINGTASLTNKTISDSTNSIGDANTYVHDLTVVPNQTGGWNEYAVTTNDFTTTNTTATDITGLVTGTLTNSGVYEFELRVRLLNAADTNGVKVAIHGAGTGTAATVFSNNSFNSNSVSGSSTGAINAVDTLSNAFLTYSAGEGMWVGSGHFTATSTGTATMSLQVAKVTSGTATVRKGSKLRIRKLQQ